jgi:hypothetical protein
MSAGLTDSDSMFSVRKAPWHGRGAVLEKPPATVAEAIEASGLGWSVAKERIAVDRGAVIAATTPVRVVRRNTLNWVSRGHGRSSRSVIPKRSRIASMRLAESLIRRSTTTSSSSATATGSPQSAARSVSFARFRRALPANGTSDSVSGRTRKSRQQTKDRIAELFLRGETQGNAPGSKWAAVNAVVEYGDWLRPMRSSGQRFARALDDGPEKTRALQLVAAA